MRRLQIGDFVRYKLEDSEKQKYGGKKIAPRNSARYQVIKKIGQWTYMIRPVDGTGQEKARHFNEEEVPSDVVPDSVKKIAPTATMSPLTELYPSQQKEQISTPNSTIRNEV